MLRQERTTSRKGLDRGDKFDVTAAVYTYVASTKATSAPNGQTLTYANGDTYVGQALKDVCRAPTPRTDKYVGQFKDGNMHGEGTITGNGDKYVGQWKDDNMGERHLLLRGP